MEPKARKVIDEEAINERFLGMIAKGMEANHVREFAVTVLNMKNVEVGHLLRDADDGSWHRCFNILNAWWQSASYKANDLRRVLVEGERQGLVRKGTWRDVCQNYQEIPNDMPPPRKDLASAVASWYQDPAFWDNRENYESAMLSWDTLEMRRSDRVLVIGETYTETTTFTKKLASDWANSHQNRIDTVFYVELGDMKENQTIESAIVEQIPFPDGVKEAEIGKYLKTTDDRVLLLLYRLDKINLESHPQIKKILEGRALRNCCTLVTSCRPATDDIRKKMHRVIKLETRAEETH